MTTYHILGGSLKVMADKSLRYRYTVPGLGIFEFPTYAEVGLPYQKQFDNLVKAHDLVIERGVEIGEKPWVVDMLVGGKP